MMSLPVLLPLPCRLKRVLSLSRCLAGALLTHLILIITVNLRCSTNAEIPSDSHNAPVNPSSLRAVLTRVRVN